MPNPWEAEVEVDAERAARLIAHRFPQLADQRVKPLGQGWDNAGFRVGVDWVFRFPRRAIAAPLLLAEAEVLPDLAPHLPVPVPHPVWVGTPGDDYPWHFVGYRYLPGRTLDRAELDPETRAALAPGLGRFLRVLHDHPIGGLPSLVDAFERSNLQRRMELTFERLSELVENGVITNGDAIRARLDAPIPEPHGQDRLCHGDLYARHVLVDEAGALAAIIDWGDLHLGDPALDLGVVMSLFDPEDRPGFFETYGPVGDGDLHRARVRALQHGVALTAYAADVNDPVLLSEGLGALERAVR